MLPYLLSFESAYTCTKLQVFIFIYTIYSLIRSKDTDHRRTSQALQNRLLLIEYIRVIRGRSKSYIEYTNDAHSVQFYIRDVEFVFATATDRSADERRSLYPRPCHVSIATVGVGGP